MCIAVAGVVAAYAGEGGASVSDALAESVAALRIQTEFPSERVSREIRYTYRSDGGPSFDSGASAESAKMLLWISLAVFLAVFLFALLSNIRDRRRAPDADGKEGAGKGTNAVAARMAAAGLEADGLADSGDYAEAMHVLLLRGIAEIRKRLAIPIAVSLTSREIVRRVNLPPEAGAALSDMVGQVEISYFGSHRPGGEEYRRCRQHYDALTTALGERGGP